MTADAQDLWLNLVVGIWTMEFIDESACISFLYKKPTHE